MKTLRSLLTLGFVSGFFFAVTDSAFAQSSFTDITVSNDATIGNAISFGQVQLGNTAAAGTSHGARLHVTQEAQEVNKSYIIPGYMQSEWGTILEWGEIEVGGHYEPYYTYGIISYNYTPPVFDVDGNEISPEIVEPVYGDVYSGETWVPGTMEWGIVGSHMGYIDTWVSEQEVPYSEMQYDAPVIHSTATRSDANWVWDVPTADGSRQVLRVWDGGLTLPDSNNQMKMTLAPSSLYYVSEGISQAGNPLNFVARFSADKLEQTYTDAALGNEDKTELTPDMLRLTRTDNGNHVRQTQITTLSASFSGVVEVAGDMKVQGALRVPARGGISMGIFTDGPQP